MTAPMEYILKLKATNHHSKEKDISENIIPVEEFIRQKSEKTNLKDVEEITHVG